MTVRTSKPALNLRERLSELDKPSGIAGQDILKADTPQEVFNYIGAGRRNWIINGKHQVNQRGLTTASASGNAYQTSDRWKTQVSNTSGTISLTNGWVRLEADAAGTGYLRAVQIVEDYEFFRGKTVTISCKVKSNAANARIMVYDEVAYQGNAKHSGSGQEETLSFTTTISTSSTGLWLYAGLTGDNTANGDITSGDYVEFTEFQLEVGSVATPFEHRSYGEELALCQRYFQTLTGNTTILPATRGTTNKVLFSIALPSAMRADPIYTNSGTGSNSQFYVRGDGANEGFDDPTFYEYIGNYLTFYSSTLTFNPSNSAAYTVFISADAVHYFSAEL